MFSYLKSGLIAFLILIPLANCGGNYKSVYRGKDAAAAQDTTNIVIDRTSKEDVDILFGPPNKISDDRRVYTYKWPHGNKRAMILGLSNSAVAAKSLKVYFDEYGIVRNYKLSNTLSN